MRTSETLVEKFAKFSDEATIRLIGPQPRFDQFFLWFRPERVVAKTPCGEFDLMNTQVTVLKARNASVNAVRFVPKQHRLRRNQKLSYHLRVQKKWLKRFNAGDHRMYVPSEPLILSLNYDFRSFKLSE